MPDNPNTPATLPADLVQTLTTLSLKQQNTDAGLSSARSEIATVREEMSNKFAGLYAKLDSWQEQRKTPWLLIVAMLSLMLTVSTGITTAFFFVTRLQTESQMTPLTSAATQLTTTLNAVVMSDRDQAAVLSRVTSENAASIKDRESMTRRLDEMFGTIAEVQAKLSALDSKSAAKFTEVETQFRSQGQLFNMNMAAGQRMTAILWNKLNPDSPYPDGIQYYPIIAQPPQ